MNIACVVTIFIHRLAKGEVVPVKGKIIIVVAVTFLDIGGENGAKATAFKGAQVVLELSLDIMARIFAPVVVVRGLGPVRTLAAVIFRQVCGYTVSSTAFTNRDIWLIGVEAWLTRRHAVRALEAGVTRQTCGALLGTALHVTFNPKGENRQCDWIILVVYPILSECPHQHIGLRG